MAKQYVCIDDLHIDWDFTESLQYADRIATYDAGMKRVLDELDKLPKFTKPEWIPCSERLPESNSERIILLYDNGLISGGKYLGDRTFDIDFRDNDKKTKVVAWMPLPKPYEAPAPERDCEHCVHHTEKGCSSWDCEFERRQ